MAEIQLIVSGILVVIVCVGFTATYYGLEKLWDWDNVRRQELDDLENDIKAIRKKLNLAATAFTEDD